MNALGDYVQAVVVTFVIPLAYLLVEYFFRFSSSADSMPPLETALRQSGPDCCILSLGASGAVFVDPWLAAVPGFGSKLLLVLVISVILILRILCRRSESVSGRSGALKSMRLGLTSLLMLFVLLTIGHSWKWIMSEVSKLGL
jgi:hypothetical protein